MTAVERFIQLAPWEQISEEDFFWVNGLYLSVRGNLKLPRGVWFCPNQKLAERVVMEPAPHPPAGCFSLKVSGEESEWLGYEAGGRSRPVTEAETRRLSDALGRVLNVYEDRTDAGVKFPVTFNLDNSW